MVIFVANGRAKDPVGMFGSQGVTRSGSGFERLEHRRENSRAARSFTHFNANSCIVVCHTSFNADR